MSCVRVIYCKKVCNSTIVFKKTARLSRTEFMKFLSAGKRYHSPELTITFTPGTSIKAAAVVGKKVAKQAVDRNRIRRRLYATLLRAINDEVTLCPVGTYIMVAKPGALTVPRLALQTQQLNLLAQIPK